MTDDIEAAVSDPNDPVPPDDEPVVEDEAPDPVEGLDDDDDEDIVEPQEKEKDGPTQ